MGDTLCAVRQVLCAWRCLERYVNMGGHTYTVLGGHCLSDWVRKYIDEDMWLSVVYITVQHVCLNMTRLTPGYFPALDDTWL